MAAVTAVIRPLWYFKCGYCRMSFVSQHMEALPLEQHLVCHRHAGLDGIQFLIDLVENWSKIEWQVAFPDGDRPG